jgi:hypothetical protein
MARLPATLWPEPGPPLAKAHAIELGVVGRGDHTHASRPERRQPEAGAGAAGPEALVLHAYAQMVTRRVLADDMSLLFLAAMDLSPKFGIVARRNLVVALWRDAPRVEWFQAIREKTWPYADRYPAGAGWINLIVSGTPRFTEAARREAAVWLAPRLGADWIPDQIVQLCRTCEDTIGLEALG